MPNTLARTVDVRLLVVLVSYDMFLFSKNFCKNVLWIFFSFKKAFVHYTCFTTLWKTQSSFLVICQWRIVANLGEKRVFVKCWNTNDFSKERRSLLMEPINVNLPWRMDQAGLVFCYNASHFTCFCINGLRAGVVISLLIINEYN